MFICVLESKFKNNYIERAKEKGKIPCCYMNRLKIEINLETQWGSTLTEFG